MPELNIVQFPEVTWEVTEWDSYTHEIERATLTTASRGDPCDIAKQICRKMDAHLGECNTCLEQIMLVDEVISPNFLSFIAVSNVGSKLFYTCIRTGVNNHGG